MSPPRLGSTRVPFGTRTLAIPGLGLVAYYLRRPLEFVDRLRSEYERRVEPPQSPVEVPIVAGDASDAIHELLGGHEAPCTLCAGFEDVWTAILSRFPDAHHHDAGRGTVQGAWTATRHLRPEVVVETGVARGFSSASILAAMEANGSGRLWSIDLPQLDLMRSGEACAAVTPELARRWTYIAGGSRRMLPRVLGETGPIDLFVHDSLHTRANMEREMRLSWDCLRAGGLLLVDDAGDNPAFATFAQSVHGKSLLRRQMSRPGAFGAILKTS